MSRAARLPVLAWTILAFAAWRSAALLHAWRHSPLDRYGWIAFGLWILPAAAYLAGGAAPPDESPPARRLLLLGSLTATLGGTLGDLNAANYLGLALAVAAIPGGSWANTLWLGTALSWMPALSWLAMDLPRPVLLGSRLLLAAVGSTLALAAGRRSARPQPR